MHKLTVIPLLLVLSSPLAATVIYSPGFTVVGNIAPPDVDCTLFIDATCTTYATGSAMVLGATFDVSVRSLPVGNGYQPFYDDEIFAAAGQFVSVHYQNGPYGFDFPVSLAPGAEIGPASYIAARDGFLVYDYSDPSIINTEDFIDTGNDILGVAFSQPDGTHYGWINFQWQPLFDPFNRNDEYGLSVDIGGYAYESCPDQPIAAGVTSGGASCTPTPESSSLMLFTLGLVACLAFFGRRVSPLAR